MNNSSEKPNCCAPSGRGKNSRLPISTPVFSGISRVSSDAVRIPGGVALVGTRAPQIPDDGEYPQREKKLRAFQIGATTVTNAQFAAFIDATGYQTEAERFGWSFVFWMQVPESVGATMGVAEAEWWRRVDGANWRDINGPGTMSSAWLPEHPVVQVSWNDACAYAKWVKGRLPTEAEWEHAARGGLGDVKFPWGEQAPNDDDFQPCNIWQGQFPDVNTAKDGYLTTAPARYYEPNGFGLYNMVGNVWEWTSEPYRIKSIKKKVQQRLAGMKGYKLSKGGSFLCHRSYCFRYRIAARTGTSPDSATTHQGFRVVWPD